MREPSSLASRHSHTSLRSWRVTESHIYVDQLGFKVNSPLDLFVQSFCLVIVRNVVVHSHTPLNFPLVEQIFIFPCPFHFVRRYGCYQTVGFDHHCLSHALHVCAERASQRAVSGTPEQTDCPSWHIPKGKARQFQALQV